MEVRALCTLPNASVEIGGVAFESTPQGLLSRPLTPDEAARFGAIPGYALVEKSPSDAALIDDHPAPRRSARKTQDDHPKS